MPKRYSSAQVCQALEKLGFALVSQRGSHKKYRKDSFVTIVPMGRKILPPGTVNGILHKANIDRKDFEAVG